MSDKNTTPPVIEVGKGAHVTLEERERAKLKDHGIDNKKEIAFLYKIINKKWKKTDPKYRINWFKASDIYDKGVPAGMIKYELEGFIHGKSMGTRAQKLYLSIPEFERILKDLRAIPTRDYIDTMTKETMKRPREIIKDRKTPKQIEEDIADPFDLKSIKPEKDEKEEKDPYDL